jgi:hypothetical protein
MAVKRTQMVLPASCLLSVPLAVDTFYFSAVKMDLSGTNQTSIPLVSQSVSHIILSACLGQLQMKTTTPFAKKQEELFRCYLFFFLLLLGSLIPKYTPIKIANHKIKLILSLLTSIIILFCLYVKISILQLN